IYAAPAVPTFNCLWDIAHEEKAELIEDLKRSVWPHIRRGAVKPVIHRTFDLDDARGAHTLMDSGTHIGKIVLTTRAAGID
ncbi:zinc-binding dehydrogenase, partial [Burkholderia cenocepacia]|uniref:zinc-binding dehydrogenase n=1 Tax=Burkholderia cenocepacia TaxID=95486 RepID=UPI0015842F79